MGGLETKVANLLADAPDEVSQKINSKMKTILEDKDLVEKLKGMEDEDLLKFLKEFEAVVPVKAEPDQPAQPLPDDVIP